MDNKHNNYYGPLDGMRAVSIIAVILYHSSSQWLQGGFLGVESFFVISGFIITTLLLKEYNNSSSISFTSFYKRRMRRLLPDMLTMIFLTICVVVILFPQEIKKSVEDILPSLSYTSNWYYILKESSYFEVTGRPKLFEHLWSLSVEFQFYLIWPFICLLLFKLRMRTAVLLSLFTALISTCLMAYLFTPGVDTTRIYFGTDTRAAGFLFGSALALAYPKLKDSVFNRKLIASSMSIISFVGLIICYVYFHENTIFLFKGGFAITACLSTICIGASLINGNIPMAKILSSKIATEIGQRAYNIYIWHWPVFCLTQPYVDVWFDGWKLFLVRISVTGVLSELSYRYIDIPVKNGLLGKCFKNFFSSEMKFRLKAATSISIIAVIGCLSLAVYSRWNIVIEKNYAASALQEKEIVPQTNPDAIENSKQTITPSIFPPTAMLISKNLEESKVNIMNRYPIIVYNNTIVDFENHFPEINSGTTCVAVTYMKGYMGFSMDLDSGDNILKLTSNGKTILTDYNNKRIKLTIGDWLSNEKIYVKDSLVYMPLSILSKEFGYSISMFTTSSGVPIVRIDSPDTMKITDNEVLSAISEKLTLYIENLKKFVEESCNAYKISFSTEKITLKKWEQIGSRLKISVVDPMKQNLKVTWSNDTNGKNNWESKPYSIDMPCPYWYSWDIGEYQVSAKVENDFTSKIITTTVKVIENIQTKVDHTKLFNAVFDKTKGYVTKIYPADEKKRRCFAVGDSVMVDAADSIYRLFGDSINVDAKVNRQLSAGKELLNEYKNKGILGDVVIIHLGTNSQIKKEELRSTLNAVKEYKKIYLINIKVPRQYEDSNNSALLEISKEYTNVAIIDWRGSSIQSRHNFGSDGIHVTENGAKLFAQLIFDTINRDNP